MEKESFYKILEDIDILDNTTLEQLKNLVSEYPYFETARLLYTKNLQVLDSEKYSDELGRTSILCTDRRKLFYLLHPDEYNEFIKQDENNLTGSKNRTDEIIDSYFGNFDAKKEADKTIEEAGMSIISTDYLSYLESIESDTSTEEETENPLQHQDIIDAFIKNNENSTFNNQPFARISHNSKQTQKETGEKDEDNDENNEFLTETLANIYIKQKKYEKALTIIKRLSLNFPKKSAYFADQIRFLEFLIINEKNK